MTRIYIHTSSVPIILPKLNSTTIPHKEKVMKGRKLGRPGEITFQGLLKVPLDSAYISFIEMKPTHLHNCQSNKTRGSNNHFRETTFSNNHFLFSTPFPISSNTSFQFSRYDPPSSQHFLIRNLSWTFLPCL